MFADYHRAGLADTLGRVQAERIQNDTYHTFPARIRGFEALGDGAEIGAVWPASRDNAMWDGDDTGAKADRKAAKTLKQNAYTDLSQLQSVQGTGLKPPQEYIVEDQAGAEEGPLNWPETQEAKRLKQLPGAHLLLDPDVIVTKPIRHQTLPLGPLPDFTYGKVASAQRAEDTDTRPQLVAGFPQRPVARAREVDALETKEAMARREVGYGTTSREVDGITTGVADELNATARAHALRRLTIF